MMLKKLNDILSLFTPMRPELTALDISELLDRPKSTVYRLLTSVADAGFLDYDELTARYRVGIRLAALGEIAQRSTTLQRTVYPTLVRLSGETRETATLMVRSGSQGTTIEMVESFEPIMVPAVLGGHPPLHASAGGKVLLAWLSLPQRREILRTPLTRFTLTTITDRAKLEGELDRVRDRGYSMVRGEWVHDIFGVAAPVRNHSGVVVAAITVGVPRARASTERMAMLQEAVQLAAADASAAGGFMVAVDAPPTRATSRGKPRPPSRDTAPTATDRRRRVRS